MAYSDAQKEATARYNKKAYDRIEIKVKKGRKAEIFAYAASLGKSVNQFITELIDKEMNQQGASVTVRPVLLYGKEAGDYSPASLPSAHQFLRIYTIVMILNMAAIILHTTLARFKIDFIAYSSHFNPHPRRG